MGLLVKTEFWSLRLIGGASQVCQGESEPGPSFSVWPPLTRGFDRAHPDGRKVAVLMVKRLATIICETQCDVASLTSGWYLQRRSGVSFDRTHMMLVMKQIGPLKTVWQVGRESFGDARPATPRRV